MRCGHVSELVAVFIFNLSAHLALKELLFNLYLHLGDVAFAYALLADDAYP